ncbi:MAG: hypothetical protein RLZZ518_572 [Actinomycetota bacterium]|jgi:hypothetical protein
MALTCENETAMNVLAKCVRQRRVLRNKSVVLQSPRARALWGVAVAAVVLAACAETPRTATNFCRVLSDRIGLITTPPTSNDDVQQLIEHYDRLVEVAPLEVEDDLATIRDLFIAASQVNASDPESVQSVADAAYNAERAAEDAGIYVGAVCGLDLSSGLSVQVPAAPPETP